MTAWPESKRLRLTGVKQPGSEAGHLPACNGEVKNEWRHTFVPGGCVLGVLRDNF